MCLETTPDQPRVLTFDLSPRKTPINMHAYKSTKQAASDVLSFPSLCARKYEEFIVSNANSVGQIEGALRSLTYIIPGRFRDAEIASESRRCTQVSTSSYH